MNAPEPERGPEPAPMSAAAPLVSIVTVYHNREALVRDSIESLLAQTHPRFEIIAVNDGSTDGTLAALRSFEGERLRVLDKPNTGFVSSVNAGVRAGRGVYVAIHGSGDISLPTRIAKQAAVLDRHPEVGVVGCHFENKKLGRDEFTVIRESDAHDFWTRLMQTSIFSHGEVMFRRDLFDRVGGYREEFTYSQDYDLWLRMSEHCGFRIVPELLYRRVEPPGTIRANPDKLLVQQYYSELARQCSVERRAGRDDLVEKHGKHAMLFMRRSRMLGDYLVGNAVSLLTNKDDARALRLIRHGVAQAPTARNLIYAGLCLTHGTPFYARVAAPLMRGWRRARG